MKDRRTWSSISCTVSSITLARITTLVRDSLVLQYRHAGDGEAVHLLLNLLHNNLLQRW